MPHTGLARRGWSLAILLERLQGRGLIASQRDALSLGFTFSHPGLGYEVVVVVVHPETAQTDASGYQGGRDPVLDPT